MFNNFKGGLIMNKFLSMSVISAIALSVSVCAFATAMDQSGDGGNQVDTAKAAAQATVDSGSVYKTTITKLKELDARKDDEAAKEINNTLGDSAKQWEEEKARRAYEERRAEEEKRAEEEAKRQAMRDEIEAERKACIAKHNEANTAAIGKCNVEAEAKLKKLEEQIKQEEEQKAEEARQKAEEERQKLEEAHRKAEAERTAKESQAAKEYAECINKGGSEARCQKQLDEAYEDAKKEYYRENPEAALKELSDEKQRCLQETTGGSDAAIASYCKMKYKESLKENGLDTDADSVEMSPEENREAKEVQAEQDYNECIQQTKSEATCSKQLDKAYEEAKQDYYKENPEAAKKDADVEYEKCTASNPGPRGEAYCASKTKETLENAGLKDQADSILSDPQDQRVAKEVQAEKEYDACLRSGKSDSTCQANYMKATDAAKLEYYRADPDKAKQEINADYEKCKSATGGSYGTELAKCNQQRDTMLKRAGLSTANE